MLRHRETHINPQRNRWIIMDPAGIELTTSRLRQLRQLPVVQHDRFTPLKLRQKGNSNDMPEDNWQPVWNSQFFQCFCTGKWYSNLKEASCLPLLNAWFEPASLKTPFSPADWMPTHKPTDLSLVEDQAKNFISTARPYDDWPFSSFDFTAVWLLFLALAKYMFVVVNVDDLAQASDIRI